MAHSCKSCGAVADDPGHLCDPIVDVLNCEFCGEENVSATHVCKAKLDALKFSCESCGRVAPEESDLCNPVEIN